MVINEALNKKNENPPFSIGQMVQLSHGLYGAEVGIILTYSNEDYGNPHLITHVVVRGVVIFYPTSNEILPEDKYLKWQIGRVKPVSGNYQERYNKLKK